MSSPSASWHNRSHWVPFLGAALMMVLWIMAVVLLVVSTRTAPGPYMRFRMIGLALALLAWGCLLLVQMQALLRTRLGATTPIGQRLSLATRLLAGVALAAGATVVLSSAIGPDPIPDADPLWTLLFILLVSAVLAILVGEMIFAAALPLRAFHAASQRSDAQPR